MTKYYRNEYLFSEIYLEEITQETESGASLASLNTLVDYRDYAESGSLTKWKNEYIHKALYALGFNVTEKNEHVTLLHPMGQTGKAIGLCYVLPPEEDLNNTAMGQNWAEKTIRAIQAENDDRSPFNWGLLTNGERWRIYHLNEPTPYETYLEIDLGVILEDKARAAYQVFFKFMKVDNFKPNEDGECQLDVFKRESQDKIDYIEKELEKALKPVEEGGLGVLSNLCMGYVGALRAEGVQNLDDEDERRMIYHGAMLYMFRLLFLLYANARNLLSEENQTFLENVLTESVEISSGKANPEDEFQIWKQLQTIFVDIDQTYNGGLFSPQESEFTAFIEDYRIANTYLGPAIYNLNTYEEKGGRVKRISYRDLGVRHLGTLYEGLLEHKLYIAEEDTEVRKSKGKLRFFPVSLGGKIKVGNHVPAGQVYFAGDKDERKSTGSYYTPEYIVDYIVRNTVGEKLKELRDAYMAEQHENYQAYQRVLHADEKHRIARLVEERTLEFVRKRVLKLSVLDPAMGSGHFLVNATNLIANYITELMNMLGIQGETGTSTATWRRWVVENCIYGVDINPLAVELAKLSLWILSMAKEQPLSFLNHHLKCGDSLVGARLNEIGFYPGNGSENGKENAKQLSLFEADEVFKDTVRRAIERYQLIESEETASLVDVEAKMELLELIDEALEPYKQICDLHTSIYFGNEIEEWQYQEAVDTKTIPSEISLNGDQRYFHWELEYPEMLSLNTGFTCIVCNPPYDTFRENMYYSQSDGFGTRNFFARFICRSIKINQPKGNIGFVVPLSFACGSSYENLRQNIYKNYNRLYASHYSKRPNMLFPGVQQRITIFFATKKTDKNKCRLYSSKLWRWRKPDQEEVVKKPKLVYVGEVNKGRIPKVDGKLGVQIYKKILSASFKFEDLLCTKGDDFTEAYYHNVSMYWLKAYDFIPYFRRENETSPSISTGLRTLRFPTDREKNIFLLLANSSLFYYWWITQCDEFHVLVSEICGFGIHGYGIFYKNNVQINNYINRLMNDYKENSSIKTTSLGGSRCEYQEFYPRRSIDIINEIDDFITQIYGLSPEMNAFLKSYDLEFRTD